MSRAAQKGHWSGRRVGQYDFPQRSIPCHSSKPRARVKSKELAEVSKASAFDVAATPGQMKGAESAAANWRSWPSVGYVRSTTGLAVTEPRSLHSISGLAEKNRTQEKGKCHESHGTRHTVSPKATIAPEALLRAKEIQPQKRGP